MGNYYSPAEPGPEGPVISEVPYVPMTQIAKYKKDYPRLQLMYNVYKTVDSSFSDTDGHAATLAVPGYRHRLEGATARATKNALRGTI